MRKHKNIREMVQVILFLLLQQERKMKQRKHFSSFRQTSSWPKTKFKKQLDPKKYTAVKVVRGQ